MLRSCARLPGICASAARVAGAAARRAALADRVRLVSQMAGAGAVRPLAGGCRPPTPPSRGPQGQASPEHHRYASGQVHSGARSPWVRRRQEGARAQARGPGRCRWHLAGRRGRPRLGAGSRLACSPRCGQGGVAQLAGGDPGWGLHRSALPRVVEPARHAPPCGRAWPRSDGLRRARGPLGRGTQLRLARALGWAAAGPGWPSGRLRRTHRVRGQPVRRRGSAQPYASPRRCKVIALKQALIPSLDDRNSSARRGPGGSRLEDACFACEGFSSAGLGITPQAAGNAPKGIQAHALEALVAKLVFLIRSLDRAPSLSFDLPTPRQPRGRDGAYTAATGARYTPPLASSAQTIRAILLASATHTSIGGLRASMRPSHAPAGTPLRAAQRATALAPMISKRRSERSPILDVRPSRSLPPLER